MKQLTRDNSVVNKILSQEAITLTNKNKIANEFNKHFAHTGQIS